MTKKITAALLSLLLAFTIWPAIPAVHAETEESSDGQSIMPTAEEMLDAGEYKPDELLITFDNNISDKKVEKIIEKKDAEVEQIAEVSEGEKVAQITISENTTIEEAIQNFQNDNRIIDVQPNYKYEICSADPYLDEENTFYQYTNKAVNAEGAWDFLETEGNKKAQTIIAVLDTGVDTGHEDLQANLEFTDGKYMRVIDGEEVLTKNDSGSHGTHVSGIIGATYGNGKGGSGVASGHNNDLVRVLMVGTSADGASLYTYDIVNAVKYAQSKGAKVFNMSFGMNFRDRIEEKAMIDAYNNGVVLVAASGNEDYNGYSDPGSMKEVIGVNASTKDNTPSYYSNYGYSSDVMAPGSNIMSTVPGDRYAKYSGTSMASPVVCGVVAMMLDANPNMTPQQVYNVLCASTGQDSFDKNGSAYGLVNAESAVKAASALGSKEVSSLYLKEEADGVTLDVGDDYSLEALARPAEAIPDFTWESDDESVATVSENGRVIGVSGGTCQITVRSGTFEKSCKVTVVPSVKAESLKITKLPKDGEICVGESFTLSAEITPAEASNTEIYFESSDPGVALVDETGFVYGNSAGTAVITAYTFETPADYVKGDDPSVKKIKDEITVVVKNKADRISIDKSPKWVWVGDTVTYTGVLSDSEGHKGDSIGHNKIGWSVNNKALASIDDNGKLTTKKAGNVYIIAQQQVPKSAMDELILSSDEDVIPKATRKLIIAKKNYKGKADYALKTVKYKKKNRVKLSWKANPIASGYQIQFAKKKNGKFKTVKTIKSGKTKTAVLKTKKSGYYRVRAKYTENGKTKWFGFSNTVKAKPYVKAKAKSKKKK